MNRRAPSVRGSVVLAILFVVMAATVVTAGAWYESLLAVSDFRSRYAVLCARNEAASLATAWPLLSVASANGDPRVASRSWHLTPLPDGTCLLVTEAVCAGARRQARRLVEGGDSCLRSQSRTNSILMRGPVHYVGRNRGVR